MSRTSLKRAFGSLRRLFRRRRAPRPSEQEWLRMILLVRRMQRAQMAIAQRLDEIRALTGVLGSFRSDFGALHEQLAAARESAGELERGLAERLSKLDRLPDPSAERAELDRRVGALDALTERLETLAASVPSGASLVGELGVAAGRFGELATRFESAQAAERSFGGQEELARLYERIQELAESVARPRESGAVAPEHGAALQVQLEQLGERCDELARAVQAAGGEDRCAAQEELLKRLERLAGRIERRTGGRRARGEDAAAAGVPAEELIPLLARIEGLAVRLEQVQVAPSVPPAPAPLDPALERERDELRIQLACEEESRRRMEAEMEAGRERLRASELARVELETRHASELSQMADHVGRQLQRVEDDLKKKKRGLAELTQQNIALQNQLARLQNETGAATADPAEPPPPLPRGSSSARFRPRAQQESPGEGKGEP